ncbi:ATP synthase epsilon chain [Dirofilaria immitis]
MVAEQIQVPDKNRIIGFRPDHHRHRLPLVNDGCIRLPSEIENSCLVAEVRDDDVDRQKQDYEVHVRN